MSEDSRGGLRRMGVAGRCSFGCRLIAGETPEDHERSEHVTCTECGSDPGSTYPVAHKPSCSRITIGPHLWPTLWAAAHEEAL